MKGSQSQHNIEDAVGFLLYFGFVTCPVCGDEIEYWSAAEETSCMVCGYVISKKEKIIH